MCLLPHSQASILRLLYYANKTLLALWLSNFYFSSISPLYLLLHVGIISCPCGILYSNANYHNTGKPCCLRFWAVMHIVVATILAGRRFIFAVVIAVGLMIGNLDILWRTA